METFSKLSPTSTHMQVNIDYLQSFGRELNIDCSPKVTINQSKSGLPMFPRAAMCVRTWTWLLCILKSIPGMIWTAQPFPPGVNSVSLDHSPVFKGSPWETQWMVRVPPRCTSVSRARKRTFASVDQLVSNHLKSKTKMFILRAGVHTGV